MSRFLSVVCRRRRSFSRRLLQPHDHAENKKETPKHHQRSENRQCVRRANPLRYSAGDQRADRLHPHEHRGVYRHHSAAQLIRHPVLNQRVRRRHLRGRSETHNEEHSGTQPEKSGLRKDDQTHCACRRRRRNPPRKTPVMRPRRKLQRAQAALINNPSIRAPPFRMSFA